MMVGQLLNILVVDDESTIRTLLERVLRDAEFTVVTAADGISAIESATQNHFDVALLDISMPGMSGIEVLHWLTANRPDVCVIMVTAVVDVDTAVGTMKLGVYDYITKPFTSEEVVGKVRNAIYRKRSDIENEKRRDELEKRVFEQTQQLQQQFSELIETLAREHTLLYKLADSQPKGVKTLFRKLPPELQVPMSSVEEFSEALIKILRGQAAHPGK